MPPREVAASTLVIAARRPRCPWELARTQSVRSLAQTLARLFASIGATLAPTCTALLLQRSLVGSLVRFLWIPGASLLPAPFARAARDRCASGGVNRGATIACGAREAKRFSRRAEKNRIASHPPVTCARVPAHAVGAQNYSGVHAHAAACATAACGSATRANVTHA